MSCECQANVYQIDRDSIVILAHILEDIDALHQSGHMEGATLGAIVSLVAWRMRVMGDQIDTECQLNADQTLTECRVNAG